MSHRALLSLSLLLLVLLGHSLCRPLSPRGAASLHRSVRRSPPAPHRRRSISEQSDDSLFGPFDDPLAADDTDILRRSIDADLDEPQDEQAFDQQQADAENDWAQFVASIPGEDPDSSYPDSFAQDDDPEASCADEADPADTQPSSGLLSDTGNAQPPPNHDPQTSTPQKASSTSSGSDKHQDGLPAPQKDAPGTAQPDAQAAKKSQADEAAKKSQADEAAKQAQAQADSQKKAAEEQQKKAAEEQAKKQAAAEKEKEDEAAAKAKQQQADQAQEAQKNPAAPQPPVSQDKYTDVQTIPGTSVTTGTVHKDHKQDSYSTAPAAGHTGDATFYKPDVGACGSPNTDSDMIVAVSMLLYDSFPSINGNPNTNKVCGKRIRATYEGRSCEVTVVDRCEGCDYNSLDFSVTAFEKLAPRDKGRLHGMTWEFI